ncbi:hypothetical protein GB937_008957 [Aspergillus fischeri]|nr:hypothetical protein GB937_008957 [Aspergillus fischeri]
MALSERLCVDTIALRTGIWFLALMTRYNLCWKSRISAIVVEALASPAIESTPTATTTATTASTPDTAGPVKRNLAPRVEKVTKE